MPDTPTTGRTHMDSAQRDKLVRLARILDVAQEQMEDTEHLGLAWREFRPVSCTDAIDYMRTLVAERLEQIGADR